MNNSQLIEQSINELLQKNNIEFSTIALGKTKRDEWNCYAWKVHFTIGSKSEGFDYFTGMGHVEKLTGAKKQLLMSQFAIDLTDKDEKTNSIYWRNFKHWIDENDFLKPVPPSATSVLHSLILDLESSNQGFEDWCSAFGYDTDSRKALETYLACQENANKSVKIFNHALRSELQELLQDY